VLPTALPTIQKSTLRAYEPGTAHCKEERKEDAPTEQGTPGAQAALAIRTPFVYDRLIERPCFSRESSITVRNALINVESDNQPVRFSRLKNDGSNMKARHAPREMRHYRRMLLSIDRHVSMNASRSMPWADGTTALGLTFSNSEERT
jgi:hypothetical protein